MELITAHLIDLDCSPADKGEIVAHIADLLERDGRLKDRAGFIEDVYKREEEFSTALGFSFAVPHAKSASVAVSSLSFLRLKQAVDWDGEPVRFVFGIAAPADQPGKAHLDVLAQVARKMIHEEFIQGLEQAVTADEALALILAD